VALARALINSPELILADEPTSDLDIDTAQEIWELFSRLNAQGTAFLVATHDVELSRRGNAIWEMHSGRLAQQTDKNMPSGVVMEAMGKIRDGNVSGAENRQ
jgi:putative ABC transport system ATP-binding protein